MLRTWVMAALFILVLPRSAIGQVTETGRSVFGDFVVVHAVDPTDGTDRSSAVAQASEDSSEPGQLGWRCVGSEATMFLRTSAHKEPNSEARVEFWYETAAQEADTIGTDGWTVSADGGELMHTDQFTRGFVRGARFASGLGFQLKDADGTTHTVMFGLDGLGDALGELACMTR
jgi:hypothetical protein